MDQSDSSKVADTDLAKMAAIKATTERILGIRTGLLGVQGDQLTTKDEKIDLLGKNVTDALGIAKNEVKQRSICDERLAKETNKNKWQKWAPWGTLALGLLIGSQLK